MNTGRAATSSAVAGTVISPNVVERERESGKWEISAPQGAGGTAGAVVWAKWMKMKIAQMKMSVVTLPVFWPKARVAGYEN